MADKQNNFLVSSTGCRLLMITLGIILFPPSTLGSNQNPKLYVHTNCIQSIHATRKGFNVDLPHELMETQLLPKRMPTISISAVAVNPEHPSFRQIFVEDPVSTLQITGLAQKAWYYVCVEFENQDRVLRRGNFSTNCVLKRTLDKFAKGGESSIFEAALQGRTDERFVMELKIEIDFPVQYDAYLKNAPRVQSYIIQRPMTLRVVFSDLVPGFDYGPLCVREKPLNHGYSSMGRSIDATVENCYLGNLRTLERFEKFPEDLDAKKLRSRKDLQYSGRGTNGAPGSSSQAYYFAHVLILLSIFQVVKMS